MPEYTTFPAYDKEGLVENPWGPLPFPDKLDPAASGPVPILQHFSVDTIQSQTGISLRSLKSSQGFESSITITADATQANIWAQWAGTTGAFHFLGSDGVSRGFWSDTAVRIGEDGWGGWLYVYAETDGGSATAGGRIVIKGADPTAGAYDDWHLVAVSNELKFSSVVEGGAVGTFKDSLILTDDGTHSGDWKSRSWDGDAFANLSIGPNNWIAFDGTGDKVVSDLTTATQTDLRFEALVRLTDHTPASDMFIVGNDVKQFYLNSDGTLGLDISVVDSRLGSAVARAFANNYSGSGDWLNEGTGGSSHDMTITNATYTADGGGDYFDLDGAGDFLSTPDHVDLDQGQNDSFTLGIAFYATDVTSVQLIEKRNVVTEGYAIAINSSSKLLGLVEDTGGTLAVDVTTGALSTATKYTGIMVVNETAGTLEIFLDGVGTGTAAGTGSVGDRSNAIALFIGRLSDGTQEATVRVFSYCLIPLALTDAEVVLLDTDLKNQTVSSGGTTSYASSSISTWWAANAEAGPGGGNAYDVLIDAFSDLFVGVGFDADTGSSASAATFLIKQWPWESWSTLSTATGVTFAAASAAAAWQVGVDPNASKSDLNSRVAWVKGYSDKDGTTTIFNPAFNEQATTGGEWNDNGPNNDGDGNAWTMTNATRAGATAGRYISSLHGYSQEVTTTVWNMG